jgi:low temperature requirement protein LtrA
MLVVIWWMYGGYAWLTNAIAPDRVTYRLVLLGGMGAFMVLSVAIPGAFSGDGAVFGIAYLIVVLVHAGLYSRSQAGDSAAAFLSLAPFNLVISGLLIAGGLLGGTAEYLLWGAAVGLIGWLSIGGPGEGFQVEPSHFVERHGLVIIVALGESVVAVGIGASGRPLTAGLIAVMVLGLALSACLWWTYFGDGDDELAVEAMSRAPAERRPALALYAFYLWHLLLLLGIVAIAAALEFVIAHPGETLTLGRALALAGGTALFLVGDALFRHTLALGPSGHRLGAAVLALATVPLGTAWAGLAQLAALTAILAAALALEHRTARTAILRRAG